MSYYDPVLYELLGLEILVPDPVRMKQLYDQGKIKEFPFWSRIWPSSIALASWLHLHPGVYSGKKLVEIGAGLGFPSFIAARHASSVLITDHIPEAVEWIERNITKLESCNISAALFDWNSDDLPEGELVLMSDVGYDELDFKAVYALIRKFIAAGSVVLLTVPSRMVSARFIQPLEDLIVQRELLSYGSTEIIFLHLGITDSL